MYFNDEQLKKIDKYIGDSINAAESSSEIAIEIVKSFKSYIKSGYEDRNKKYSKLVNTLWDQNTKHIKDVFQGEKLEALQILLGDKHTHFFKKMWDRSTEYIYSTGYSRRSYRTDKSSRLYLEKNIDKLKGMVYLAASGFSLDTYLNSINTEYNGVNVIADLIAFEIDNDNQNVFEKVKAIVYDDNNTAVINREIIKGLLMSRKLEAYKLAGDLLLAAKLQEGLRQAIVESVDECSKEAFLYILKIIIDNNLMRFSSVVRAFGTWTGIALDVEKPKVIKKCFQAAYDCLTIEEYKNECINSDDNLLIYIGIWSIAFNEVEDIDDILYKLLNSDQKYKKLVSLQFVYDTSFTAFKHRFGCSALKEEDLEVVSLAVKNLFNDMGIYQIRREDISSYSYYCNLDDKYYGISLFNQLKSILDRMPKKEIEFNGSVFPWINYKMTTAEIMDKMLFSSLLIKDNNITDILIDYKEKMSVDAREAFVEVFLKVPQNTKQKKALIEACGDRGTSVSQTAFKIINTMDLSSEDYLLIEDFLQYKSGKLRKNAIQLLLKQESSKLLSAIERLIKSSNENKRLAAIEIVGEMKKIDSHKEICNESSSLISSMENLTQKQKIMTENITQNEEKTKDLKNGLGIYERCNFYCPKIEKTKDFNIKSIFSMKEEKFKSIINKFSELINKNREYEYETEHWDGTKTTTTLGGQYYLQPYKRNDNTLNNYPMADEIRELVKNEGIRNIDLIEMSFYLQACVKDNYKTYTSWFEDIVNELFNSENIMKINQSFNKAPYFGFTKIYINLLLKEVSDCEKFELSNNVLKEFYLSIPEDKFTEEYFTKDQKYYYYQNKDYVSGSNEVSYWIKLMKNSISNDEDFKKFFSISYSFYKSSGYNINEELSLDCFGRALELNIINENEVYEEFLNRPNSSENIRTITNLHKYDRNNIQKYSKLIDIGNKAVDIIANIEVKRGELNTEVTHLASKIQKCYGVSVFASIILSAEKDTYVRGYNFIQNDCTKKQMLSHLLKCCYPKEGESATTLAEYLKGKKVSSRQLIDVAMYSPQWLDIAADYLKFDGLKSACWYFHAHVNEYYSNEKAAMVARYSPIELQDFKDGAFDKQWFQDAFKTMGEEKFMLVYDGAKYIAGGGLHKRSQLFSDASLGKLNIEEVKARVMDKRNKDYLLTYALIPIKNKKDMLERYEYIHKFIKESKQFGSQRQASEGRCGNIALLNLARNAGYSDVNRLSWNMETAKIDSIKVYLEPHKIDEIEVRISINELGQSEIECKKDSKVLKDIPSKYKKNEYVTELKNINKSLKDQYSRARKSFEVSMENGDEFQVEELVNLCTNPVLSPIIKNLIFMCNDKFGYLTDGSLIDYEGKDYKLNKRDNVFIAHPVHLFEAKIWSEYQKDIFKRQIVQPFKQVFRELYIPNEDELKERTLSRRYAGYQIQPRKAAALLKTRGWVSSEQEGLQKVYYKENIVAEMYALADWFSPSDIESPAIEFVRFENRKTFMPVPIDEIPKLIFSEIMRDVDLVVSVAHVGGVDVEASLSTIEVRSVIIEEIIKLLKLKNVKIKGTHAIIKGVHGEYTVHLGSGVVHKMDKGAINIIPVHSGQRGRIFLPFIDGDPKSAEIVSKIIFLSEDNKIKDPSVLEQIL
ncbi:MAG: DUF4132 domain-containing protein [Bacillota bacterium]|nr:DUF4132 domain-containing protein [Bacillota bacterium]